MPTAFVATYGSGQPVIGFLAEFDALPGLSQDTVPYRKPLKDGAPGQGCGHNTFGVASSAAAVSLSKWLAANKQNGTIKVYGTPAEEGGAGKVYLVREGLFKGVDVVLDWHPSSVNAVTTNGGTAMVMVDYKFYGKPAHAAGNPWKGRSALDAVEALGRAEAVPAELLLGAFHCVDLGVDVPAQVFHGRGNPLVLAGEAVSHLAHEIIPGGE